MHRDEAFRTMSFPHIKGDHHWHLVDTVLAFPGQQQFRALAQVLPKRLNPGRRENPATFGRCTVPAATKPQCGCREHHPASHPENHHTGQPTYQMTLETNRGSRILPVELDLRQALKSADAKRKQAEASVRFRARRRERAREASQLIPTLQQEVRDLRKDRDFYRNERNYIRDFTSRQARTPIPPRAQWPTFLRLVAAPAPASDAPERMEEERNRSNPAPAARGRSTDDHQTSFWQPYGIAYASAPRAPPSLPMYHCLQERPDYIWHQ